MTSSKRFLICGAGGQLGKEWVHVLTQAGIAFVAPGKSECNIADYEQVAAVIDESKPDIIINCAAYNFVDDAEREQERAMLINGEAVGNLASLCEERGIFLVHYGTDYVFDGKKKAPYTEEDAPHPVSVYATSKLLGEKLALELLTDVLVFRVSWVFGLTGKNNFLAKVSEWAENNDELAINSEEVSVPTYTEDIVSATLLSLEKGLTGLYHLCGSGQASRYDLTEHYIKLMGMRNTVKPVPQNYFNPVAQRPGYSVMSNVHLAKTLGIDIPTWQQGVERYVKRLKTRS